MSIDNQKTKIIKLNEIDISGRVINNLSEDPEKATPTQKLLADYFFKKTNGLRLAKREDLVPSELVDLLPNASLFDVYYNEKGELSDLRFRLLGTELVEIYGEWTGKFFNQGVEGEMLNDVLPVTYSRVLSLAKACIENRSQVSMHSETASEEKSFIKINSSFIPFSSDGEKIDMLFGHTSVERSV